MFDGDVTELDADAALAAAVELRVAAHRAEAKLLEVAAHYADLHPKPAVARAVILPGMENTFVCGGDGCPEVAEFAPVELGAALGMSSGAATGLMSDALGLRHRLPLTWARVLAGEVQAWRARQVARATRALSRAAAALVDARVAGIVETVTPWRLDRIVEAAVMQADPDHAQAQADTASGDRGVWVTQSDLAGTKTMVVKAAAGDVIRFEARTDQVADLLAGLGDTDTKDVRRAKAVGWLADPQTALDLLSGHTATDLDHDTDTQAATAATGTGTGTGTATGIATATATGIATATGTKTKARRSGGLGGAGAPHTLYVHLSDQTLAAGTGLVRVAQTDGTRAADDLGPLLASQLAELLGHDRIVVKPVIDVAEHASVDAYEIPDWLREHVLLHYTHCIFPWCNRPATTHTDLDHIVPFDDTGPPGQTSTDNLGPGCRFHHRVKTHSGWRCQRLPDGAFVWTSPHGRRYRVDHTGTRPVT